MQLNEATRATRTFDTNLLNTNTQVLFRGSGLLGRRPQVVNV